MATWTAEKRRQLPKSDFGDPARSAFPISDQEDLDNAFKLIGHARNPAAVRRKLVAIARRKGLKLPDSVKDDPAAMSADGCGPSRLDGGPVAAFDLNSPTSIDDEEVTYADSLLFRVGSYPEKAFEMSTEEAWLAVDRFVGPVLNELDHIHTFGIPTILDNRLGEVREIRLSEDGQEIRGTVAIPRWLDSLWTGPKRVSAAWNRGDKTLLRLGLVMKGHVDDAALMAAFSAAHPDAPESGPDAVDFAGPGRPPHRTAHGTSLLQKVHDLVMTGGAVCLPANSPAPDDVPPAWFTSAHERSVLQSIHTQAVRGGATCALAVGGTAVMSGADPTAPTSPPLPRPGPVAPPAPSRKRKTPMDLKKSLLALFGSKPEAAPDESVVDAFLADLTATVQPPATPPPATTVAFGDTPESRAQAARIADLEAKLAVAQQTPPAPAVSFSDSPEGKALAKQIEELRKKNEDQERKSFEREVALEAAAFAEGEIRTHGRALPSERAALVMLMTRAMIDDHDHAGVATFSADGTQVKTSRAEMLRQAHALRPPHQLTREFVRGDELPAGSTVLFHAAATTKDGPPSQERIDGLLSMLPEGKEAIRLRKLGS